MCCDACQGTRAAAWAWLSGAGCEQGGCWVGRGWGPQSSRLWIVVNACRSPLPRCPRAARRHRLAEVKGVLTSFADATEAGMRALTTSPKLPVVLGAVRNAVLEINRHR